MKSATLIITRSVRLVVIMTALAPSIFVGACGLVRSTKPDDLTLQAVDMVNQKERADIVWLKQDPRPSQLMVRVKFSTKLDLANYAHRHSYNVMSLAAFCKGDKIDEGLKLRQWPSVFDSIGEIDFARDIVMQKTKKTDALQENTYHVYFDFLSDGTGTVVPDGREPFSYDLQQQPRDVCIQITGGNMIGGRFVSNTIRVPKEALIDAMSRAGLK